MIINPKYLALSIIGVWCTVNTYASEVQVIYDRQSEALVFAAGDIQTALSKAGHTYSAVDITEAAAEAKVEI